MKVLVATTSLPSSLNSSVATAGIFVLHECVAYEQAGASVEIVAPDYSIGPREEIFGKNIKAHRFRYFFPRKWQILRRPDGSPLYQQKSILAFGQLPFLLLGFLWAILKHGRKADIVHCNWSFTALAALPLRWIYKVPVVLTTRGSDLRLIPKFLNRFIFSNVDAVIDCFGPDYRNLFSSIPANYVELPVITPQPDANTESIETLSQPGEFLLVMVGRFDLTKLRLYGMAFFTLLEAIAALSRKHSVRGIYVGDGPLMPEIQEKCLALGCQDRVQFVGYQQNVYPFLQAADLVFGGLGLNAVSQEASLMGKVQVMPKIENWYESIWFDRQNALLYDPDDSDSVSRAVSFALENPDQLKQMAHNIATTANEYIRTVDDGGRDYLGLFDSIIKKRSTSNAVSPER